MVSVSGPPSEANLGPGHRSEIIIILWGNLTKSGNYQLNTQIHTWKGCVLFVRNCKTDLDFTASGQWSQFLTE